MNAENSSIHSPSANLAWEAFRYVSEDMTPDEIATFEHRLADEQTAREAVALAMRMTDGLWLATALESLERPASQTVEPAPFSSRRASFPLAKWVVCTAMAACFAFCIGWWVAVSETQSPPDLAESRPQPQLKTSEPKNQSPRLLRELEGAGQLVELWTNSEALVAELALGPATEFFETDPAEETSLVASLHSDEDTFGWMLAALSAEDPEAAAHPQSEPAVMEN